VTERRIALTFDAEHSDRPSRPGVVESILDTLERRAVRATFFMQGRWVEANPGTATKIVAAGHLVGNHSYYHARMTLLSDQGFKNDVRAAERVIRRVCRVDPQPWFRLPFGAGADDRRSERLLERLGYQNAGWDVDSGDWRVRISGPRLASETLAQLGALPGDAVVLFHSWPGATASALPVVIDALLARGTHFVAVDALLAA